MEGKKLTFADKEIHTEKLECFSGVNMKGAVLEESNMAGVNLRVCNARFANLQNCTLRYNDSSFIPTFSTRFQYLSKLLLKLTEELYLPELI